MFVRAVFFLAITVPSLASGAQGTDPQVDAMLAQVTAALEAGDTVGAIAMLQEARKAHPRNPRILGELAWVLAAHASEDELETAERMEAERLAEEAWRLDPEEVKPLVALARVRVKQRMYEAAERILGRVKEMPAFANTPPPVRAELHYLLGRRYETKAESFEHLVRPPDHLPVATPACIDIGAFCDNFRHPVQFNELMERSPSLESLGSDEALTAMIEYRTTINIHPRHIRALGRLLLMLADAGDWDEYLRVARSGVDSNPRSPEPFLWLGMGLHWTGDTPGAEAAFAQGLQLASRELAGPYRNPLPLLTPEDSSEIVVHAGDDLESSIRVLWTRSDPLHLTQSNERRVEHMARVAYTDLKFSAGAGLARGSQTDAGRIFVRYGPPRAIWSVARDRTKETDAIRLQRSIQYMEECTNAEPGNAYCNRLEASVRQSLQGSGRWIFWNYDPRTPSLVFTRDLQTPDLEYMRNSYTKAYAEDEVRARLPSVYEPFELKLDIPNQIVRFKGESPDRTAVETYAAVPVGDLVAAGSDSIAVGVFFFDAGYTSAYRWQRRLAARPGTVALTVENVFGPGAYEFSIEAHDPGANTVARARGSLPIAPWPADSLTLSDLLIADRIVSLREPAATARDDLSIRARPDLMFRPGEQVGLYWEVYGLSAPEGVASYRVTLEVRDAERRGLAVRVVRAIAGVLGGGEQSPKLSWEREVPVADRDRAIDWILLEALPEGEHSIVVTVEDLGSGNTAMTYRQLTVQPANRD